MEMKKLWINAIPYSITQDHVEHDTTVLEIESPSGKDMHTLHDILWDRKTNTLTFSYKNRYYRFSVLFSQHTHKGLELSIYSHHTHTTKTITLFPPKIQRQHTSESHYSFTKELLSPLTGKVIKLFIEPRSLVSKNQPLLLIESMKMENEIVSPHDAFVKTIQITENAVVDSGQVLMTFEEQGEEIHASRKDKNGKENLSHR